MSRPRLGWHLLHWACARIHGARVQSCMLGTCRRPAAVGCQRMSRWSLRLHRRSHRRVGLCSALRQSCAALGFAIALQAARAIGARAARKYLVFLRVRRLAASRSDQTVSFSRSRLGSTPGAHPGSHAVHQNKPNPATHAAPHTKVAEMIATRSARSICRSCDPCCRSRAPRGRVRVRIAMVADDVRVHEVVRLAEHSELRLRDRQASCDAPGVQFVTCPQPRPGRETVLV